MKRKTWIIVTVCLAAVLICAGCLLGWGLRQGIGVSEARYIETAHGHMLLIGGSPVSMSGKEGLFEDLTTGDRVLVAHGLIAESYPGQAKAYLCIKQSDGTAADIPEAVLQNLREMGWLAESSTVTYEYGCVTMSLDIPENWESRFLEHTDNMYGIEFWPAGQEEHTMALCGYPEGVGFCGTGLTFENITVAGHEASAAYYFYEDLNRLEHIYFTDIPGDFVFINRGLSFRWEEYGEQIMQIAETVQIQVDTISQTEAQNIAEEHIDWDYYAVTHQLDHQSGDWTVTFWSQDREYFTIVTVSADGQILSVALPD